MKEALQNIGITATEHVLYLTVTSRGSVEVRFSSAVPTERATEKQYVRSKEIGLTEGISTWGEAFHRPGEQVLQSLPRAGTVVLPIRVARV